MSRHYLQVHFTTSEGAPRSKKRKREIEEEEEDEDYTEEKEDKKRSKKRGKEETEGMVFVLPSLPFPFSFLHFLI